MAPATTTSSRALYDRQQAAEFFSISTRTLDQWEREGLIKATRFGRLVRYHRDELERVASEGLPEAGAGQ